MSDLPTAGPLAGQPIPMHGGAPDEHGCGGCTDCCHLPEISLTDEEATRVRQRYRDFREPMGQLIIAADPANEGWNIMRGPCVFRRLDLPLMVGGCRIYDDRPTACDIFTCAFLLKKRRALR